MIYKSSIDRLLNELTKRMESLESELKQLPEGELYVREKEGNVSFYNRLKKEGNRKKEKRSGVKKDPDLMYSLIRKKYVIEAIERLSRDIERVADLQNAYEPFDENSVMERFLEKYPDLVEGVYHGTFSTDEWAKASRQQSDYHKENLTSTAADGTGRRSLGEIVSGAKLDQYGIPYRYEEQAHPDLPYMPDFTIIRPRDGKRIFWEHIGKVNDKDYMAGNRKKFADYESVGIVPWENLIISYSQADGGINEKLIDALIHGWLL